MLNNNGISLNLCRRIMELIRRKLPGNRALSMKDKQAEKGFILLMVMSLALIISVGIVALLFILEANRRNLESVQERTQAYYLCELGASAAILDVANGKIGSGSGQWTERTFTYRMGSKDYPIKYTITKVSGMHGSGDWEIVSQVGSSAGFHRTYKLHIRGKRAFPVFSRGFPGK